MNWFTIFAILVFATLISWLVIDPLPFFDEILLPIATLVVYLKRESIGK